MKSLNFYIILFFIVLFNNSIGIGQPNGYRIMKDTSAFKKNFNDKSIKTITNQADFIQEKYISVLTDKSISKGKFYFKKQNQMRWETISPFNHVIVLKEGKMTIKENGKVKTYDSNTNKMFKGLNDLMLMTASGNMLSSKNYTYKLYENDKYYLTELIPVNTVTKKYIAAIEVYVEKSDYSVSQIKMIEPSKDYTRIEFSNKKMNETIDDSIFLLKE